MTNWIQPMYTLYSPRGANQNTQYTGLPNASSSFAYGRAHELFEKKIQYPVGTTSDVDYSNNRPNTITPLHWQTGSVLQEQTAAADPRVDNYRANPYAMKNMEIQKTSFVNRDGIIVMILAVGLLGLVLSRVR